MYKNYYLQSTIAKRKRTQAKNASRLENLKNAFFKCDDVKVLKNKKGKTFARFIYNI